MFYYTNPITHIDEEGIHIHTNPGWQCDQSKNIFALFALNTNELGKDIAETIYDEYTTFDTKHDFGICLFLIPHVFYSID